MFAVTCPFHRPKASESSRCEFSAQRHTNAHGTGSLNAAEWPAKHLGMRCENRGAYRRYADPAVGIGAGIATFISQAWLRRKTGAATALRATVAVSSLRALLQSATMQPPGLVADEGSRANGSPHLSGGTDTSAHAGAR